MFLTRLTIATLQMCQAVPPRRRTRRKMWRDVKLMKMTASVSVQNLENFPTPSIPRVMASFTFTYPVVLVDRWGATDDLATSSLHSSRLSAFLMAAPSVMPVHSGMLSSHIFFLSSSSSPSLHCALQDCLGKPWTSCYVPVPFQIASFYCGQEVFAGPNGLPSSVSHLFVGDVVSVGVPRSFLRHLISMACNPSLCVCCHKPLQHP